jgi:hypothetical protein
LWTVSKILCLGQKEEAVILVDKGEKASDKPHSYAGSCEMPQRRREILPVSPLVALDIAFVLVRHLYYSVFFITGIEKVITNRSPITCIPRPPALPPLRAMMSLHVQLRIQPDDVRRSKASHDLLRLLFRFPNFYPS